MEREDIYIQVVSRELKMPVELITSKRRFREFCEARQAEIEYIGHVPSNQQVAVRIKKIGPPRP